MICLVIFLLPTFKVLSISWDCDYEFKITKRKLHEIFQIFNSIFRYMMCHKSEMGRSVQDILRIARAFRFSDLNGKITPAGWQPGDSVIPVEFLKKNEYYQTTYKDWTRDEAEDR